MENAHCSWIQSGFVFTLSCCCTEGWQVCNFLLCVLCDEFRRMRMCSFLRMTSEKISSKLYYILSLLHRPISSRRYFFVLPSELRRGVGFIESKSCKLNEYTFSGIRIVILRVFFVLGLAHGLDGSHTKHLAHMRVTLVLLELPFLHSHKYKNVTTYKFTIWCCTTTRPNLYIRVETPYGLWL